MACPALEAVPAGTAVVGKAHTQAEIGWGTTEAARGEYNAEKEETAWAVR